MAALIFISYSSRHRDLTAALAGSLEEQYGSGSVWWDRALEARAPFEPQIRTALEQARVVVVIWSAEATTSNWVYSEASDAARDGKLLNVRPADVPFAAIPKPFDVYHVDDLAATDRILDTIASMMRGDPVPTRVPLAEIYWRQHGRRVLVDPQRAVPDARNAIGPVELLQAKYALVGYDDASGMCQQLMEWCQADRPVAGRLVHGAGGAGKTRLLMEVARRLRIERGWTVGFLERPPDDATTARQRMQALEQLIAEESSHGLLIVMDYAEARQAEFTDIAERLWSRTGDNRRPLRLVLLARSAGDWWTTRLSENEALQGLFPDHTGGPATVRMRATGAGHERLAHFRATVEALAPVMRAHGYTPATPEPPPARLQRIATGDGYARPLAIQMEAVLWLAGSTLGDADCGVDGLLARVLGIERAHWTKLLGPLDDPQLRDVRRSLAQVTVAQGVDSNRAAEQLLMADRFYGDRTSRAAVDPVLRHLTRLYGRPDGGIRPLEPDLVGEHHVATTADIELLDGCVAWIEGLPEHLRPQRRVDMLNVLQRATQEEHGAASVARASALLDHLVEHHTESMAAAIVAVMGDTPGALFSRLEAHVDAFAEPELAAIAFALPRKHVSWMEFSLCVAERYAQLVWNPEVAARAQGLAPDDRLAVFRNARRGLAHFALRLSSVGQLEAALDASAQAVKLARTLVREQPDAYLPELATSLNDLGNRLAALGQRDSALTATQEAVDIYRALGASRPQAFLAELASSLNNLGIRYGQLGRREDALGVSQEAVSIRRALARDDPHTFLPDLANSLNNLGAMLSRNGRREAALTAARESVDLYRGLAEERPEAFLPDLATSVHNLGIRLSNRGRREEAVAASEEAVALRRSLARERPRAFLPDLATSLGALAEALAWDDRHADAAATAQEGLATIAPFAESSSQPWADLARALAATHLRACERAGRESDRALLERVSAAVDRG